MNKTRYGNKSVIADIWDDDKMPRTEDGRQVDILLNLLAIINRTTSMVLYELFITGAAYQVRQKMKDLSLAEQENMLFKFIRIWNEGQEEKMHKDFDKLNEKGKIAYINDAIENGILIHQNPMWETCPIFYRCQNLLREFPFIQKDTCYVRKWGRDYKVLSKYFVGSMYIMKLKQSDRRGFSARSTGALDSKSLPTRSFKSKSHLERISSSCIRFGEYESLNFSIGILSEDIALFHALYRTSIKGRKDLINLMFSDELNEDAINQIDSSYTSRVAEIFNVILKSLGIGLDFVDDDEKVKVLNDEIVSNHSLNGVTYFCTDYQFYLMERTEEIKEEILRINPVLTKDRLNELVEEEIEKRFYVNGPLKDSINEIIETDKE